MNEPTRSPAELRNMFGANLRQLASQYPTISGLTQQLGINRTQFNRYLSGESFPRPDVLDRICRFFQIDARILLSPLDELLADEPLLTGKTLGNFLGVVGHGAKEEFFQTGFYRTSRPCPDGVDLCVVALVHVARTGPNLFIRGFDPVELARRQGSSPSPQAREFRGFASPLDQGVALVLSHRETKNGTLCFLTHETQSGNGFWIGTLMRTRQADGARNHPAPVIYEHLGSDLGAAFSAARTAGLVAREDLPAGHSDLLHLDNAET